MTLVYNKFNRGVVDSQALARDDVQRVNNSASLMHNFIPSRLGAMKTRPGFEYMGSVLNATTHMIPFFGGLDNTALLEFTDGKLRIWADDAVVSSTSVTTSITNGTFDSNITGWTDNSDASATTAWYAGSAELTGSGVAAAQLYQTLTTEVDVEHTARVVVKEAPIEFFIGTNGVGSDDVFKGTLSVGTHSLVFTPTADITITLKNAKRYRSLVDSVTIQGDETLVFDTDVTLAQLSSLRFVQSADVVFFTYDNGQPFRVERRGTKSWSLVEYRTSYPPFGFINDSELTLTPGALTGNTTLTANKDLFTADSVGNVYKLLSNGQQVSATISAADSGTGNVRVTGTGESRNLIITLLPFSGSTVTLQRSTDEASWVDVENYDGIAISKTYNDELDNSIVYYRLYVKSGNYGGSPIEAFLTFAGGSIEGICRVTEYTSATEVNIQVLTDFGSTDATRNWYESEWSVEKGYPTAVTLYEGRLWFAGKDRIWGSVSDEFTSFDDTLEGVNRSIAKTIGFGAVDTVQWLEMSSRLIMGLASDEVAVRSSSFGEILSSTNANLKAGSSQGVAPIAPIRLDDDIIFVQRAKRRLFQLVYDGSKDRHGAVDLNTMNNDVARAGFKRIVVVRQPETRIIGILEDGTGVIFTFDPLEDVKAWSTFSHAAGAIDDIVVLPAVNEDRVYIVINGGLERMFLTDESHTRLLDSSKVYTLPGTTLTGLEHLEGVVVAVWADGVHRGYFPVNSGSVTLSEEYADVTVGREFTSDYRSNKLSQYQQYSVLTRRKRVESIGFILENFHPDMLHFGSSFDRLYGMPTQELGKEADLSMLVSEYDEPDMPFSDTYNTDSRVHIRTKGAATILAMVFDVKEAKTKNPSNN